LVAIMRSSITKRRQAAALQGDASVTQNLIIRLRDLD
jgi:hypothetical protein